MDISDRDSGAHHRGGRTRDVSAPTGACGRGAAALASESVTDDAWQEVVLPAAAGPLIARLALPPSARTAVVLADDAADARSGPCGRRVVAALHGAGLGTLLLGLVSEGERPDRHLVYAIGALSHRLSAAGLWLRRETGLTVGYVGHGTGGSPAALRAAAEDDALRAVVACGGRPELAGPAALARVRAPVLLLAGGRDPHGCGLCRLAADWMRCPRRVTVVPDTDGRFAEPTAEEAVAGLVRDWFTRDGGPGDVVVDPWLPGG